MTKIKFCGLRRIEDLALAEELCIDYAGFVTVPSSRRYLRIEEILHLQTWLQTHNAKIQPVLVIMDMSLNEIGKITAATGIRHVQLAARETPEFCQTLRTEYHLTVWKTWHVEIDQNTQKVAVSDEISSLSKYQNQVDAMLLDTSVKGNSGGTGVTFPWRQIPALQKVLGRVPMLIAGGLTPDNVGELVAAYHPYGVDVSSGIEVNGQKDENKMRSFVQSVRGGI